MLEPIVDHIWAYAYPANLGPGVVFPCRTTVIRADDVVVLYSPGPFTPSVVDEINGWGKRVLLVAPNLFHHFYFQSAREQFPDAVAFGPLGLESKNKSVEVGFRSNEALGERLGDGLTAVTLPGAPSINETVLYHANSETLVVCDAFFNMRNPQSFLTSGVLRMTGTHNRLAQSRLFRFFVKDKSAFYACLSEVLAQPIARIVVAHGEITDDVAGARALMPK